MSTLTADHRRASLLGFLVASIFGSYARLTFPYLHLMLMWALAKALESDADTLRESVLGLAPFRRIASD